MVAPQLASSPLALLRAACGLLLLMYVSILPSAHAAFCTQPGDACWPDKQALNAWIATLSGATSILLPDKTPDRFISYAVSFNGLKTGFPGIIVSPVSEKDLRSALQFALRYRLRVVSRCSGADYNGRSTGRGVMLIRTEKLNLVEYDTGSQTVTFGAGALHDAVYSALAPFNRLFVGALAPATCPAGCLAGGCHGLLSRQYGLGIDSVLSVRLMLYNGTLLTANRNSYADLFHAFLGAGANSFGVAVAFTAATHPAPRQILKLEVSLHLLNPTLGGITYPNLFSDFLFNLRWFTALPNELSGSLVTDGADSGVVYARFFYVGSDYVGAFNALRPMFNSPYRRDVAPLVNYTSLLDAARDHAPSDAELWSRSFLANALLPAKQDVLNNAAKVIGDTRPPITLNMVYGGAVWTGTTGSVPNGMRGAVYGVAFGDRWYNPAEDERRMAAVEAYLPMLYGFGMASYSNEYTTWGNRYNTLNDWKGRFFSDYAGLVRVKQKYDPCNMFTVRFGIASDLASATC